MISILSKRVIDLDLTVRAHNCLINLNIVHVGDLVRMTPEKLLREPNMGKKSLAVIVEELERYGLRLGMKEGDIVDAKHQSRADDLENFIHVMWLLRDEGIRSIGDLIQKTEDELLVLEEVGPAEISIIRNGLEKWGLQLGMHRPNPPVRVVFCEEAGTVKEELLYVVTQLLSGARWNRAQCFISYHGIDDGENMTLQEIADRATEYGFAKPVSRERIRQVIGETEKQLRHRRVKARFVKWQSAVQEAEEQEPGGNPIWSVRRFVSLFGYGSAPDPTRIFDQLKVMSDIFDMRFPFKSITAGGDKIIINSEDMDTFKTVRALENLNSKVYYTLKDSLERIGCDETLLSKIIETHPRWAFLDDACRYFWRKPVFPLQSYHITSNAILTCLCKIFSVTRVVEIRALVQSIPRHKLVTKDVPSVILKGIAKQSRLFEIENENIVKSTECEWTTISRRDLALLKVCVEYGQVVPSDVIYSSLVQYGLTATNAAVTVAYSPFLIHVQSGVGAKEGIYKFVIPPDKIDLESLAKLIDGESDFEPR